MPTDHVTHSPDVAKQPDAGNEAAAREAAERELTETREWRESLDYVLQQSGPERVARLLREQQLRALEKPFRLEALLSALAEALGDRAG